MVLYEQLSASGDAYGVVVNVRDTPVPKVVSSTALL